jgi:hypothetical protein
MEHSPRKSKAKEEQTRLLNEHKDVVKAEAQSLRKACDDDDLKAVLRHASAMLDELRTGSLTPKVRARARARARRAASAAPPLPSSPLRLPRETPPASRSCTMSSSSTCSRS